MLKIRADIVSGFLGAGKTTLIRELVGSGCFRGDKVAILENEFGKVDFDGKVLAEEGVGVESVVAECICCGGAETLLEKLKRLSATGITRLIIEPSGVVRLSDIRRLLNYPDIRELYETGCVLTVVDAENCMKWHRISGQFFENQIRFSDAVYLSKTQSGLGGEAEALVKRLNPLCPVVEDPRSVFLRGGNAGGFLRPASPGQTSAEDFESATVVMEGLAEETAVRNFLEKSCSGAFGEVVRIKGRIPCAGGKALAVDAVADTVTVTEADSRAEEPFQLTLIGKKLDKQKIKEELTRIVK